MLKVQSNSVFKIDWIDITFCILIILLGLAFYPLLPNNTNETPNFIIIATMEDNPPPPLLQEMRCNPYNQTDNAIWTFVLKRTQNITVTAVNIKDSHRYSFDHQHVLTKKDDQTIIRFIYNPTLREKTSQFAVTIYYYHGNDHDNWHHLQISFDLTKKK